MITTLTTRPSQARQAGFSLAEVMTAMFILSVGMVSMLALFSTAVDNMEGSQEDLICKQKAREAVEAIFTARESAQINFSNINNTGTTAGGIFVVGSSGLQLPGPDGLLGTGDDTGTETMVLPGPDGVLGTADDQYIVLSNYQRSITISPLINNNIVNPDVRQLTVTVSYTNAKGRIRSYTINTLISRYR
jgi:prepilin-type N-terminal cleavage/methylation domain-containing protein